MRHKLNLIQALYLRIIEKKKQGKKLTNFVLFNEKDDFINTKKLEKDIKFNEIFIKNYEENKEKIILFLDDKNQVWEITPQPHLNENILKEGNYQFLKSLEEVQIINDNENSNNKNENIIDMENDIEVNMNNSFYNENKKYEYDNNNQFYQGSEYNNISEESQGSNAAQFGDAKRWYI